MDGVSRMPAVGTRSGPHREAGDARAADADGHDADLPSDEELSALALAADPDAPLGPDAVPLVLVPASGAATLPEWYMPPVGVLRCHGWRTALLVAVVVALVVIDALGLCATYGSIVLA